MKKIILLIITLCNVYTVLYAQQAGIGAGIKVRFDSIEGHFYPYVIGFKAGMPAQKVLKIGDKILKIDEFNTRDVQEETDIMNQLRGQDSTEVTLLVRRPNEAKATPIKVQRVLFKDASVAGKCLKGDCVNGSGLWLSPTNEKIEGTFKGGVPNGQCKTVTGTGEKFEGMYVAGKRSGIGKLTKMNKEVWEGNYENDQPNGFFKIRYANATTFEGQYTAGQMTGHGKRTQVNGDLWEGEYKNGVANGFFTVLYKVGDRFDGLYENGKRNGWGKFVKDKFFVYEGNYKADKRVGYGQYTYVATFIGKRVEGEYISERCNKGLLFFENTEKKAWKYEGGLDSEARPNGVGKLFMRDGKWEEGKFVNGQLDKSTGKGVLTLGDTKAVKASDKEAAAATAAVGAEIETKLKSEGYELETKLSAEGGAHVTLSGKTGCTYVVAALTTAKANLFSGTIGNKEKAELSPQNSSDPKAQLLYQLRDGNGTPMFASASSFSKGSSNNVTILVFRKQK